ncbi:hypothetical protein [Azospirillum sp. TSO22-1]|uniref:hypothetical protein n=1 Tax=Azospirillum sp. TSO22-1 TaxID=716789 RepID=UPI000D61346F|nr:hypothetical protein [Azospirillum sp. TSO22-1]PWC55176.1 hypothetical protein TSO221_06100 [Azospirillum sp. TSO22-1]
MTIANIDDGEPERIPSADEVRAETEDWTRRINDLFETIRSWLPADEGYEVDLSRTVLMDERMTWSHGLPAYRLPSLGIRRAGVGLLRFVPDARWVYFTRGRIMIQGMKWPARLLDKGAAPGDVHWRLYTMWGPIGGIPFDAAALQSLLGEPR